MKNRGDKLYKRYFHTDEFTIPTPMDEPTPMTIKEIIEQINKGKTVTLRFTNTGTAPEYLKSLGLTDEDINGMMIDVYNEYKRAMIMNKGEGIK